MRRQIRLLDCLIPMRGNTYTEMVLRNAPKLQNKKNELFRHYHMKVYLLSGYLPCKLHLKQHSPLSDKNVFMDTFVMKWDHLWRRIRTIRTESV